MSNEPTVNDWLSTPETTHIPVRGDCGHIFTVALARLKDGAEFNCTVCGQPDRFDEAALEATMKELADLQSKEGDASMAARLGAFLTGKRSGDA